jgi:hypothetical protein
MKKENAIADIYKQAFADVLHEHASQVLCGPCQKVLESHALARYKILMAKKRKELSGLQIKAEREKQREARYREFRGRAE